MVREGCSNEMIFEQKPEDEIARHLTPQVYAIVIDLLVIPRIGCASWASDLCTYCFLYLQFSMLSKTVQAISPYLWANTLVCHNFMDVGKSHETPGSEKDSLLLLEIVVARVSSFTLFF